ncbi:MAG: DUF1549 and DUF1553 domain-containing protein [Gemmataceae bacterium]
MTRCLSCILLLMPGLVHGADVPPEWAYKPVTKPALPAGANNPVDAFLPAKSNPAEKRPLLRRITFDLTGLPPTSEEMDAFLKDNSPNAYGKVVDRLLASPRYGERQALFWLDLVRFAESDGFKADDFRPTAWRYRDYIIQSFNDDKPYDRFIKEQLAGDEIDPENPAALIATGFLRHSPYEYNAVDVEQKRQDMLNDIADTTASAFLGITLGCAKCHDHKTDPITQRDYYRFQAFFAGFWPKDEPILNRDERRAFEKKLAEWEAKASEVKKELDALEKPVREKAMAKERFRFPKEYSSLIDLPMAERDPLQKQLAMLVERQVYSRAKVTSAQMPAAVKPQWETMTKRMAELEKDRPPEPPTAMCMTDVGTRVPTTYLLKRGSWRARGEEMTPGFLSAIDDRDAVVKPATRTSGRRTALAEWIADAKNPLTSRTMVNRIWQQHFGNGIVGTSSDLGVTGDRPTHPELLDWLAAEFSRTWSVKHIHRLIVTSAAYRQSTFPRRRLDGEALRDAMLASASLMNNRMGGPSVFPELPAEIKAANWKPSADAAERNRRSIYVCVKRNLRYPLFSLFDSPDRVETCSRRFVTTTAPQALTLLNDAIVLNIAKSFGTRVLKDAGNDPEKVIDRVFELALSRLPTTEERTAMRSFLNDHKGTFADAVTDLCHSVLNLNEFLYVD